MTRLIRFDRAELGWKSLFALIVATCFAGGCAEAGDESIRTATSALEAGGFEVPLDSRYGYLEGEEITVDLTGADGPGGDVTATWTVEGDPAGTGLVFTPDAQPWRPGEYDAAVELTSGGTSITVPFVIEVVNVPPTVTLFSHLNAPTAPGQPARFFAEATDPGRGALSFAWTFGDGSPVVFASAGELSPGQRTNAATHAYATEDSYELSLVVSDGVDSAEVAFTVVIGTPDSGGGDTDSDGDGMTDEWEQTFDFNPNDGADADEDPDGDGLSNLEEFEGGTNPRVSNAPVAPVILSPVGEAVVTASPVDLIFENSRDIDGDALLYELEIYSNASLSEVVGSAGPVAGDDGPVTVVGVDGALVEDARHFWRVRAFDGVANSEWSEPGSFVFNSENLAPPAPSCVEPFAVIDGLTPTFVVTNVVDADDLVVGYEFEVGADSSFGDVLANAFVAPDDGAETSWSPREPLPAVETLSWRARARDGAGATSDWCAPRDLRFTSQNGPPATPVIVAPIGGAEVDRFPVEVILEAPVDPDDDEVKFRVTYSPEENLGATVSGLFDAADSGRTTIEIAPAAVGAYLYTVTADGRSARGVTQRTAASCWLRQTPLREQLCRCRRSTPRWSTPRSRRSLAESRTTRTKKS